MKLKKILFLLCLIPFPIYSEEIKCPEKTSLIDFVLSYSSERMQVCQKKVDGKFVKHGPEFIFHKDGTLKSKKYYHLDLEVKEPSQIEQNGIAKNQAINTKCPPEANLINETCIPKNGFIWKGKYSCPLFQGETLLTFTMGLEETLAIFEFVAKNGKGKFKMKGKYFSDKKTLIFLPVEWVEKPKNYSMVGMSGIIDFNDHPFKGEMTGCALFDLRADKKNN